MTEPRDEEYSDELREALEFRDVPVEAIEQIVREVESHVVDSGEDPVIAFGPPSEYAINFAPRSRMTWFWALIVSSVILASGGAYILISGIFGLLSSATLWGLPAWGLIVLGMLGIAAFCMLVLAATARSKRRSSSWRI
ncbi:hypothetical protein GCM10009715_36910 [Paeniglutamicibacter psychrophenolicus]|uniref:HAAS signaling domain-containing protein n=1 Tax=Paeniglutamicibacter psychrophenolicus TaxID=257454 RepID=UPI003382896D